MPFLFHVETPEGTTEDHEGAWYPDIDRFLPKAIVIAEPPGNRIVTVLMIKDVLPDALRG